VHFGFLYFCREELSAKRIWWLGVFTLDGHPEIILTHIEVESRWRGNFPNTPEGQEVRNMISVCEQRRIEQGKRDALLRMMRRKFGELPEGVRARVEALKTADALDRVLDRVIDAATIEEVAVQEN
jgi:hypothetical protein